MKNHCEYLIVGQGLAGSLVAQELIDAGKSVVVVDPGHERASSNIAAGIINPITGRRFVKSWRIDELLPFAEKRYAELSRFLGCDDLLKKRTILRVLFSAGEENEWLAKTMQDGWQQYANENIKSNPFEDFIFPGFAVAGLNGAQLDMPGFINKYRTFLKNTNRLIPEPFTPVASEISNRIYREIRYDNIIFCEGANGRNNPLWSSVEFEPAKGEIFHLKIPGLEAEQLLKHKMMLAPLANNIFWFGSNYEWNADDDLPSEIGRKFLTKRLNLMLRSYEEVGHYAATRPTIKDRRPVMGQHREFKHCYLLNGLGTKGASLGPCLAREFSEFLLTGKPVLPEISVKRYYKY